MISGRPHPVWRCEDCGHWQPRNGRKRVNGSSPDCPHCARTNTAQRDKPRHAPLTAAVRFPPRDGSLFSARRS